MHKNIIKSEIRKAIRCLGSGFSWSNSEQGINYWKKVEENLEEMLEENHGGKDEQP